MSAPTPSIESTCDAAPPPPGESQALVARYAAAAAAAALPGGGIASAGFDIVSEIGRGGMGVVFRAVQRSLRREVAVKVLQDAAAAAPEATAEFEAEALITGRLEHPSIPPIYGYDPGRPDAGSRPFLAMKLVRGFSWADLIEPATDEARAAAAGMDLRRHLAILRRVCEAVGFAHSRGIVHRDLKPQNVMVGEFGEVLVMDWGIAVDLRAPRPAGPPRSILGSPAYMAPEMAQGRDAEIGPWTDVYLLGAILYKLLTGTPPHRGATAEEVLLAAALGKVEPPAVRAPERKIDEGLAAIAMRALDPDPGRRFASAAELAAALEEEERHESALALAEFGRAEVEAALALARGGGRPVRAAEVYGRLHGAIDALEEAARAWPTEARIGGRLAQARISFAEVALDRGDLDFAEAQIERAGPAAPGGAAARARLERLRAARAAERRRRRSIVAGLAAAALLAAGAGIFEWRRASELQAARERRRLAQEALEKASWSQYESRVAAAERATAIDPTWPEGWSALGRESYAEMEGAPRSGATDAGAVVGAFERASAAFARAVEAGGASAARLSERAYCAALLGEWETAASFYRRCAALGERSRDTLEAAGLVALADGRFAEAAERFTACMEIDPQEMDYFNRAAARFALGDFDGALADARAAERLTPTDEWYPSLVAAALIARGDLRGAGRTLADCLRIHDQAPHALPLFALRAALLGDGDRARAALARAREAQARWARAALSMVPWFAALARAPAPHDRVGRAILLDVDVDAIAATARPAPSLALRREAEALLGRGEAAAAIAAATRAISEDPADGAALLVRGRALLRLGHAAAAREDLEFAEVLAPERAAEARTAREAAR